MSPSTILPCGPAPTLFLLPLAILKSTAFVVAQLHAFLYLVVGSYVGIQVAIRRFRGGNMLDELVKAAASRSGGPKLGAAESSPDSSLELGAVGHTSPSKMDAPDEQLLATPGASPPSSPLSKGGSNKGSSVTFGAGVKHAADGSEPRELSLEVAADPGLVALIIALTKRAEFPLLFLWLTLGAEVVITSQLTNPPKVKAPGNNENEHEQYVFLLMVLLATIFFTLATSVYVRLVANSWQLSKVWILSVCTELVAGASAAILFVLMQSVNVVAVCVFGPPLLLFTAHAYHLVRLFAPSSGLDHPSPPGPDTALPLHPSRTSSAPKFLPPVPPRSPLPHCLPNHSHPTPTKWNGSGRRHERRSSLATWPATASCLLKYVSCSCASSEARRRQCLPRTRKVIQIPSWGSLRDSACL